MPICCSPVEEKGGGGNKIEITKNCIHLMDCVEGLKLLKNESIDVIVTSPPYNLGISYSSYSDDKPRKEYLDWLDEIAGLCKDVLKEDGSFFINVGGSLRDPWVPLDVANVFRKHFVLQNTIHWIKSISVPEEDIISKSRDEGISIGHYKPINSPRFHHDCHEYIFHFSKNGNVALDKKSIGVPYQDKSNIRRWKSANGSDRRDRGNVWFIPYETIQDSRPHPAVFPKKLPEMCIMDHGIHRNCTVLDPFMGIGSTALACVKLNVDYIGFEIDENYYNIAKDLICKEKQKISQGPANILKKAPNSNTKNCVLSSFL